MLAFLRSAPRSVLLFLAGDALFGLAIGGFQALSALHLMALGADARLFGLFGGLSGSIGLALSPFIGMFADYRRRLAWLSAVAVTIAGLFVLFLTRSITLWWLAQGLISYGITAILIVESAILAPLVPALQRPALFSLSLFNYSLFGAVGAPAAGFMASWFPWGITPYQAPLLLFTLVGALCLPLFALVPVTDGGAAATRRRPWEMLKPGRPCLIGGLLGRANALCYSLITPFIAYIMAVRFHWDARRIGVLMGVVGAAAVVGPLLSNLLPPDRLNFSIGFLYAMYAVSFSLMFLPVGFAFAGGVVIARVSRQGLVPLINTLLNNIARPEERGAALSWRMFGYNGGSAIASTAGGYIINSPLPLGLYGAGIAVCAGAMLFASRVDTTPRPGAVET